MTGGVEWRYLPTGKMRHALVPAGGGLGDVLRAVCGIDVWRSSAWRGTGSQDEYERVARLPACRRCVRLLA